MIAIQESAKGVTFAVRVHPRAHKDAGGPTRGAPGGPDAYVRSQSAAASRSAAALAACWPTSSAASSPRRKWMPCTMRSSMPSLSPSLNELKLLGSSEFGLPT